MKLSTSLLVPAFIGAASAGFNADVYIFQGEESLQTSKPPTLTPEQARLVLAQRIGSSQYHDLSTSSESTLAFINSFGGTQESLFEDAPTDKAAELVLIVEGVDEKITDSLLKLWTSVKPAFSISNPPSMRENKQLVKDLNNQSGQTKDCQLEEAINPFDVNCWDAKSKVIHYDLGDKKDDSKIDRLLEAQARLSRWAKKGEMNILMVLMPSTTRISKSPKKPYGIYETPSQVNLGRRQATEEIISESMAVASSPPIMPPKGFAVKASNSSSNVTLEGPQKVCHDTIEGCNYATNGCSGNGACFPKYGGCFTCGCVAQNETYYVGTGDKRKARHTTVTYGGPACNKRDVSGPFWLITVFTIVMVGLVSWAIGMMFSIGEEKLPGVIGAGVSSKAR